MTISDIAASPHFCGWAVGIPVSYLVLCIAFRMAGLWPEKLSKGTRGSDYMTFDIVAGSCLTFFGVVGTVSWFDLFHSEWSYRLLDEDKFYGNADFVQNYLILPIMLYQFWNTVLCLILPDLRDPVMIAHHLLTCMVAYNATHPFGCYYALFFSGLSETTQLPLTVIDVFDHFPTIRKQHPVIDALSKSLFGVMFFCIRIVLWTIVSFEFVVDAVQLLHHSPRVHDRRVVVSMLLANVILTSLQYFWAFKIIKVALLGEDGGKKLVGVKQA